MVDICYYRLKLILVWIFDIQQRYVQLVGNVTDETLHVLRAIRMYYFL